MLEDVVLGPCVVRVPAPFFLRGDLYWKRTVAVIRALRKEEVDDVVELCLCWRLEGGDPWVVYVYTNPL